MANLPDGIYLDLSFEEYLAEKRLSSGSITDLMEGPSAFWAKSWMNPDRNEREETDAMKLGSAYHCARLEPEKFGDLYVMEMDQEDLHPDALCSDRDYKAWLKEHGHPQTKAHETVLERAIRIRDLKGPQTWHEERHYWEKENTDKIWLTRKQMGEILCDQERIRDNPEVASSISNGLAEVSILWTDEATGIKLKARPDYLGANWITHLKTWDSKSFGKPGNNAVADTFQFNHHYRTGWFYQMALDQLHGLPEKSTSPISKRGRDLIDQWKMCDDWQTLFLYVRRSGIPDIRLREIEYLRYPEGVREQRIAAENGVRDFTPMQSILARKADIEIRAALRLHLECCEIHGTDGRPWYPRDLVGKLGDEDFSSFFLDTVLDPR